MRNYYRMFGLSHSADRNEIRRAYRELARRCQSRPETPGASPERLASLHRAYEVLSGRASQSANIGDPARGSAGREAAFADEVDIDFPSVSSLVNRMRDSFFGLESGHPLSAEASQRTAGVALHVPSSHIQVPLHRSLSSQKEQSWLSSQPRSSGSRVSQSQDRPQFSSATCTHVADHALSQQLSS
ncbi:MAG: hypothetical protein CL477_17655, partial [Acidobacteria bacterium]|nr:hypothetical protein [Acidobacteriota bacterium]